ncbi:hypothetical protein [Helicobacter pylori]|uniref:hypothetical protein n=1 Tax=Helicobacter pylori TaxID=210 RepID=UPI0039BDF9B2
MGALGLLGVRDGKSQTLKELVLLGIKNYKEQDFSQAKEYFKKRLDAIMLKIMLEWVNFCKGMDLRINLKILPSL